MVMCYLHFRFNVAIVGNVGWCDCCHMRARFYCFVGETKIKAIPDEAE